MTNPERCSCGAREKNKCSKESEHGGGKMCLRDEDDDTSQGGYTSCGACNGYGCDRCMPQDYLEEEL
jgi:hypothetical protein